MAIKSLIERVSTAYSIGTPMDGAQIDFRHICNNVSEFDDLKAALNQEFRREGLITLDLSDGKVKVCTQDGDTWNWKVIPFDKEVQELIKSAVSAIEVGTISKINGSKTDIDFTIANGNVVTLNAGTEEYSFESSSQTETITKASASQIESLFN